jgi:hypothetical protein
MRKINPTLILIQWLGIFFLINGILRFFYSFNATELEYLNTVKEKFNLKILSDFLSYQVYWAFGSYFLGMAIVALINWKKKNHFLNTIFVSILGFTIFPTKILFRGVISDFFNYLGGIFTKDYTYSFLIGGLMLTLIGSLLIWKSISLGKGTAHNSGL